MNFSKELKAEITSPIVYPYQLRLLTGLCCYVGSRQNEAPETVLARWQNSYFTGAPIHEELLQVLGEPFFTIMANVGSDNDSAAEALAKLGDEWAPSFEGALDLIRCSDSPIQRFLSEALVGMASLVA